MRMIHVMIATALAGVLGCGGRRYVLIPLDAGPIGGGGGAGPDAGGPDAGGTGGSNPCPGQCLPGPAVGWTYPYYVWIGADESAAPSCWTGAPVLAYEGHAGLVAPVDCGICNCAPPAGICMLPATMTANAATCAANGPSTPHTPFDPSNGWIGSCDTNDAVPSGKLCSGAPCVQSLTIGPLVVSEGGCTPSAAPAQSIPTWSTFVRVCGAGNPPSDPCANLGKICMPDTQPGFLVCIEHDGDVPCPTEFSPYADKHVFYATLQDTRGCSACTCDAPMGSTCSAPVSVYSDGACGVLAYTATVGSTGPACNALPPGTPLGSKAAGIATYAPGVCTPGGGLPMGAATPTEPSTYCCLAGP